MAGNHRRPGKMILFIIEVVVIIALGVGIVAYAGVNARLVRSGAESPSASSRVSGTKDANANGDAAEENSGISDNASLKGYTNIALVGIDTRDSDNIDYANSDTMIICSINNDTKQVRMVSLYRDTLLNIGTTGSTSDQGDAGDDSEMFVSEDSGGTSDSGSNDDTAGDEDYSDGGEDYSEDGGASSEDYGSGDDYSGGSEDYYDDGSDDYDGGNDNGYNDYAGDGSYDDEDYYASRDYDNEENTDTYTENTESVSSTKSSSSYSSSDGRVYNKCNAAYAFGSAKQMLSMMNKNLDLNLHDYIVVDFKAVSVLAEALGGIDMNLTYEEAFHLNNYCVETSKVTGDSYTPLDIPDQDDPYPGTRLFHLNGVQTVAYARIRYTIGNDFKRTQRQRLVIEKLVEKAKARGLLSIQSIISEVFPLCKTSFSSSEVLELASQVFDYDIEKTSGFPFEHIEDDVYIGSHKYDCVVPVTLAQNVKELHAFLFDDDDYDPSSEVKSYSEDIAEITGYGDDDISMAAKNSVIGNNGGEADTVK